MAYTNDQIRQWVDAAGIGNDPYAISNYARQFGVSDAQVGDALGYSQDQINGFRNNLWGFQDRVNGQGTNEDVNRTMGGGVDFSAATPHKAFAAAQLNHWTPQQADQALGLGAGTSANWAKQQGLNWGDWSGNGPAPTRYSQMMTRAAPTRQTGGDSPWDGWSPSTTGARPGGMPNNSTGGWSSVTGQGMPGGASNPYSMDRMPGVQSTGMNIGLAGGPGGMNSYNGSGWNPGATGSSGANPYSQNPATNWMAQSIIGDANQSMGNQLAGIRRGAIQAGGLGGSRQGLAEGTAIGEGMRGLSGNLANLYSGQYNQDRNYGLQSDQFDLNAYNANQNWMRQGQQDQLNLIDRMLGWNQQGLNTANQAYNTPLNYWQQFSNAANQFGGLGGSQSQNNPGNPWLGGLGGAMTGYNLYNNWGR